MIGLIGGYYLLIIISTLLLCLRYGQGTDYLAYDGIYQKIATGKENLVHGEVGWVLLNAICYKAGISFVQMEALLSLLEMACLHRCIRRFSPMLCLSFLLFLPTFWFTYYCSSLRQAVVLAVFLGFGLELLLKRRYILYCLVTLFLMTFHIMAVALLVLPFAVEFLPRSRRGCIVVFGLFVLACFVSWMMLICFPQISYYTKDGVTFSFKALAMRLFLLGLIGALFMCLSKTKKESRQSVGSFFCHLPCRNCTLFDALSVRNYFTTIDGLFQGGRSYFNSDIACLCFCPKTKRDFKKTERSSSGHYRCAVCSHVC